MSSQMTYLRRRDLSLSSFRISSKSKLLRQKYQRELKDLQRKGSRWLLLTQSRGKLSKEVPFILHLLPIQAPKLIAPKETSKLAKHKLLHTIGKLKFQVRTHSKLKSANVRSRKDSRNRRT